MATITVKNIPDDLYERLKEAAEINRRSINSEIIVCIEHVVGSTLVDASAVLATARVLRQKTAATPLTDAEFTQAKIVGRP